MSMDVYMEAVRLRQFHAKKVQEFDDFIATYKNIDSDRAKIDAHLAKTVEQLKTEIPNSPRRPGRKTAWHPTTEEKVMIEIMFKVGATDAEILSAVPSAPSMIMLANYRRKNGMKKSRSEAARLSRATGARITRTGTLAAPLESIPETIEEYTDDAGRKVAVCPKRHVYGSEKISHDVPVNK